MADGSMSLVHSNKISEDVKYRSSLERHTFLEPLSIYFAAPQESLATSNSGCSSLLKHGQLLFVLISELLKHETICHLLKMGFGLNFRTVCTSRTVNMPRD